MARLLWTVQNSQFGMSATRRTVIVHGVPNDGSAHLGQDRVADYKL